MNLREKLEVARQMERLGMDVIEAGFPSVSYTHLEVYKRQGFFYPVVPKGQARIRTQISAAHTREQRDKAIEAFCKVGKNLGVIS